MNIEPRSHADLIRAWANGSEIQELDPESNTWVHIPYPVWFPHCRYRIHPPFSRDSYKLCLKKNEEGKNRIYAANSIFDAAYFERQLTFIRWITDWEHIPNE